jgi:hypothetical protein
LDKSTFIGIAFEEKNMVKNLLGWLWF